MILRQLTDDDAPALMRFYNDLSPESIRWFRPLGYKTTLETCQRIAEENTLSPAPRYDLVACDETGIIGWVFIDQLAAQEPSLGIGVADRSQNQGLGKALLTCILGWAREQHLPAVYLIAVQDNDRAVHLYKRNGFVTYGEMIGEEDQLPYFKMVLTLQPTDSSN
jgi:ribosomal protein S18 acetylase RimI-like enzyme